MTRPYRLTTVAAALFCLSLALSGASAHAAPGIAASASVSNSKLTVIDLTPGDGQAAGYSFDSSGSRLDASLTSRYAGWTRQENFSNSDFAPIAAAVSHGTSTSSSTASKFGEVRTDLQLYDSFDGGNAMGNVVQSAFIRVDPHTQLIYSGHGEVSISDATQYGHDAFLGNVEATVWFGDARFVRGMAQGLVRYDTGVRSGDFSLSYVNNSDRAETITVLVNVLNRAAYYAPSPVPEPATYAMFGIGALLVGALGRRRRRLS